ncbi:hypothetical protein R1sor_007051 [Riccia sorocarpa]|uniref:Uncharacterized protein n=1 Tax=Riccia sorocarpa TaxID=122646 RepID=A0ABD3HSZ6_9MARC
MVVIIFFFTMFELNINIFGWTPPTTGRPSRFRGGLPLNCGDARRKIQMVASMATAGRTLRDNKKHVTWEDAIVEEKRRRDEAKLDTGPFDAAGPRVTRRRGVDIAVDVPSSSRAPPPLPGPMEGVLHDVLVKGRGQKASVQKKNKAPAYKLAADIETSTDLKAILENGILDARVEFFLRNILGIAKREFHELIIDVIKRKR